MNMISPTPERRPLFPLGQVYATPGAIEALEGRRSDMETRILDLLHRHMSGDWGNVDPEDIETNNQAVEHGFRVLSAYPIDPSKPCEGHGDNCIWIITEADRSVTTILLPEEY